MTEMDTLKYIPPRTGKIISRKKSNVDENMIQMNTLKYIPIIFVLSSLIFVM
jgi:hypothetical protein